MSNLHGFSYIYILSVYLVPFNNVVLFFRPMASPKTEGKVVSFEQQLKNGLALAMLEILDSRNSMRDKTNDRRIRNTQKIRYGHSPLKLFNIFI